MRKNAITILGSVLLLLGLGLQHPNAISGAWIVVIGPTNG